MELKVLTVNTEEEGYDSEGMPITVCNSFDAVELPTGVIIVGSDTNARDWAHESRNEIDACGGAIVTSVEDSGRTQEWAIDSLAYSLTGAYGYNGEDFIEDAIEWLQGQASTAQALVIADRWEQETNPEEYELDLFEAMGELHPLTVRFKAKWPSGFSCDVEFSPEEDDSFIFDDLSVLTLETIHGGQFSGRKEPCFEGFVTLDDIVKGQALKIEEDHPEEDLIWESYEIKDGTVIFK